MNSTNTLDSIKNTLSMLKPKLRLIRMHPWGELPLQGQSRREKEPRQICLKWLLLWPGFKGTEVVIPVWALIPTGP